LCPEATFKLYSNIPGTEPICVDQCISPFYGDRLNRECTVQCPDNYVKF
jgi:hypothetical protein